MESFIAEPGVPLLTFGKAANGEVEVSQSRFFLNPKTAPENAGGQVWTIPVCFKTEGTKRDCELLTSKQGTLKVPNAPIFYADGGACGLLPLGIHACGLSGTAVARDELGRPERIGVVGDELALMRAGKSKAGDFLSLAASLKNDDSAAVTQNVISGIKTLWTRVAATNAERKELSAWVVSTYGPRLASLGEPKESETPEQQELRAELFGLVGGVGQDPKVIAESRPLAQAYLDRAGQSGSDAGARRRWVWRRRTAIRRSSICCRRRRRRRRIRMLASEALYELARFKDPELTRRALEYAASGKVRNQDAIRLFAIALQSPKRRTMRGSTSSTTGRR